MTGSWHGGKGDRSRPFNRKKWDENYNHVFPEKKKHVPNPACAVVYAALKSGKLLHPGVCELCGSDKKIEAHHNDYLKPLSVQWLCHKCHMQFHKTILPQPIALCGHGGRAYAKSLCRSCYEKDLRMRNPEFAERQRELCRQWNRRNNDD